MKMTDEADIRIPDSMLQTGSELSEDILSARTVLQVGMMMLFGFTLWAWIPLVAPAQTENAAYFLDVGQGDAQLVELTNPKGGTPVRILIDGGKGAQVLSALAEPLGDDRYIDLVVVSHPDLDHFGGLIDVMRTYEVGAVLTGGTAGESDEWTIFTEEVAQRDIPHYVLAEGDVARYGDSHITILWPNGRENTGNTNESSLVMMLTVADENGDVRALFTGDIGKATEDELLVHGYDVQAEILKVAHHGSKNSSGESFVAAVRPEISIIGVGKNGYGHPTDEVLTTLERSGSLVYTTEESGTIKVPLDRDAPRTTAKNRGFLATVMSIFTGSWQDNLITVSLADAAAEGGESTLVAYAECDFDEPAGFREGAMRINEVAWMGAPSGATHEWIELLNTSDEEADLTGWQIINENGRLHVTFPQGSLFKEPFIIAARSAADTALDLDADILFSGSIRNNDEVLRLFDKECYVVDEVGAASSWPGGDNGDKRTMERTSDGLWGTSEVPGGTPRAQNTATEGIVAGVMAQDEEQEQKATSRVYADFSQESDGTFRVYIQASELALSEYDVKASVLNVDGTEVSETYHENEGRWRSSLYYLAGHFTGDAYDGALSLRLKEQYIDFTGPAMISVRVRQSGTSNYVEYRGSIVIAGTPRAPAQEEVQERDDTSEEKGTPAPKVSVQYPSTVRVGEEFTVSLSGEHLESIQYDVKIAVEDAGVISRTWRDGGWSSSQYYVASALAGPAGAAELRLVVPEKIAPAAMLSVRLRKSGSSSSFVVHEGVIRIDAALTPEELPPDDEIEQTEPPQESESPPACININTASESELDGITGIGPVLATRIVEERTLMPFISLDDLTRVSGIGPTAVGKIKAEGKACI